MFDLVAFDDFRLFQHLESVELTIVLLTDKYHLAIGTLSNDADALEILLRNVLASLVLLLFDHILVLLLDLLVVDLVDFHEILL